ncbi:MAG: MFS transporter [Bacteroidota bacterium]|nr:MFS transporter [Bacteroidota bacterium]
MHQWKIKISIFINYFVFAILLNSVGTVILQVQNNYGVTQGAAAILEPFKDLSIAIVSFIVSSFITKLGYKKSMLIALGFISLVCFSMPYTNSFFATKLLFAAIGASFALIKISVYSTIGLVTRSEKEHISLMNFIESFFMVGILAGYFIFSYFVNDKDPHSTSWLKVYIWLGACTTLAFILLLSASLDESKAQKQIQKVSLIESFVAMFRLIVSPIVLIFIACAFFYVLIEQSIMSWLPTFNSQVLKLPTTLSIEMASILAGSTAAGRFLAGLVLKKLNWFVTLLICLILATLLVLVAIPLAEKTTGNPITGWSNAPIAAFIFPMIGLLIAPIYPAINSVILTTLSVEKQGVMSGLIIIFSALGGTTGSLITGNIFQYYGGTQAFYFSLVPIAILAVCLFIFRRLQIKHKQQIPDI